MALPALSSIESTGLINQIDWMMIFRELGTELPSDYLALAGKYPPFTLDEFLAVRIPRNGGEQYYVEGLRNQMRELGELRDDGRSRGYVPYPEPGGLICWGSSCDGDGFYWRTSGGSPDLWGIVVRGANDDWHEFSGSLTAYLAGLVSGEVSPDGLPPDFPGPSPLVEAD